MDSPEIPDHLRDLSNRLGSSVIGLPAVFLLESVRPLRQSIALMTEFLEPFWCPIHNSSFDNVQQILQSEQTFSGFLDALEESIK